MEHPQQLYEDMKKVSHQGSFVQMVMSTHSDLHHLRDLYWNSSQNKACSCHLLPETAIQGHRRPKNVPDNLLVQATERSEPISCPSVTPQFSTEKDRSIVESDVVPCTRLQFDSVFADPLFQCLEQSMKVIKTDAFLSQEIFHHIFQFKKWNMTVLQIAKQRKQKALYQLSDLSSVTRPVALEYVCQCLSNRGEACPWNHRPFPQTQTFVEWQNRIHRLFSTFCDFVVQCETLAQTRSSLKDRKEARDEAIPGSVRMSFFDQHIESLFLHMWAQVVKEWQDMREGSLSCRSDDLKTSREDWIFRAIPLTSDLSPAFSSFDPLSFSQNHPFVNIDTDVDTSEAPYGVPSTPHVGTDASLPPSSPSVGCPETSQRPNGSSLPPRSRAPSLLFTSAPPSRKCSHDFVSKRFLLSLPAHSQWLQMPPCTKSTDKKQETRGTPAPFPLSLSVPASSCSEAVSIPILAIGLAFEVSCPNGADPVDDKDVHTKQDTHIKEKDHYSPPPVPIFKPSHVRKARCTQGKTKQQEEVDIENKKGEREREREREREEEKENEKEKKEKKEGVPSFVKGEDLLFFDMPVPRSAYADFKDRVQKFGTSEEWMAAMDAGAVVEEWAGMSLWFGPTWMQFHFIAKGRTIRTRHLSLCGNKSTFSAKDDFFKELFHCLELVLYSRSTSLRCVRTVHAPLSSCKTPSSSTSPLVMPRREPVIPQRLWNFGSSGGIFLTSHRQVLLKTCDPRKAKKEKEVGRVMRILDDQTLGDPKCWCVLKRGVGLSQLTPQTMKMLLSSVCFFHERGWVHTDMRVPNLVAFPYAPVSCTPHQRETEPCSRFTNGNTVYYITPIDFGDVIGLSEPKYSVNENWERIPLRQTLVFTESKSSSNHRKKSFPSSCQKRYAYRPFVYLPVPEDDLECLVMQLLSQCLMLFHTKDPEMFPSRWNQTKRALHQWKQGGKGEIRQLESQKRQQRRGGDHDKRRLFLGDDGPPKGKRRACSSPRGSPDSTPPEQARRDKTPPNRLDPPPPSSFEEIFGSEMHQYGMSFSTVLVVGRELTNIHRAAQRRVQHLCSCSKCGPSSSTLSKAEKFRCSENDTHAYEKALLSVHCILEALETTYDHLWARLQMAFVPLIPFPYSKEDFSFREGGKHR